MSHPEYSRFATVLCRNTGQTRSRHAKHCHLDRSPDGLKPHRIGFAERASFLAVSLLLAAEALCAATGDKVSTFQVKVSSSTPVAIAEVYGGGGNSGAVYKNDYIVLFNQGTTNVDLSGWSVQYASSSSSSWSVTPLGNGTIAPGGNFLVQEYAGTSSNGLALPSPDVTDSINMAARDGKVALLDSTTKLTTDNPVGQPGMIDFVGYGGADAYEGTGAAPSPSSSYTTSAQRKNYGFTDTDDNANDFFTAAPNPRNSLFRAAADSVTRPGGSGVKISVSDLLANDTSSGTESIVGLVLNPTDAGYSDSVSTSAGGTVTLSGGWIFYTPPTTGDTNPASDTFEYVMSDGTNYVAAYATISTNAPTTGQSANIVYAGVDSGTSEFVAHFAGIPGQVYTVEHSTNVFGPWTKYGDYTAPTDNSLGFGFGIFEVRETMGADQEYYRTVFPSH